MQETQETQVQPQVGRPPGVGNGNPLQNLPGKFHGQRSLVGHNPKDCKDSDMTKCAQVPLPPNIYYIILNGLVYLISIPSASHQNWEHCRGMRKMGTTQKYTYPYRQAWIEWRNIKHHFEVPKWTKLYSPMVWMLWMFILNKGILNSFWHLLVKVGI